MLCETYQSGGLGAEASLIDPQIACTYSSLPLKRLSSTSRSENSKLFATLPYREVHEHLPDLYEALQIALYENPT
jgi:hypothetical protein